MIEMIKYLLCVAGGVGLGYFIAGARLEGRFERRLDQATEEAKDFYRRKYSEKAATDYVSDPEFFESAIRAAEALKLYEGVFLDTEAMTERMMESHRRDAQDLAEMNGEEYEEPEEEEEEVVEEMPKPPVAMPERRIMPGPPKPPLTNYNRISTPTPEPTTAEREAAYVPEQITQEEYDRNLTDYRRTPATYFSGDDILANEKDEIISVEARKAVLGDEILAILKAGPEAMGGETTLYVRNSQVEREFEIVWSQGSYKDEVGEPIHATTG